MANEIKTLSGFPLQDLVGRYDSIIGAEHVDIPCVDDLTSPRSQTKKVGRLIYVGTLPEAGVITRYCIYGGFKEATASPTYANYSSWYYEPCTSFVIGHTYRFAYHVVGGSQDSGSLTTDHYFDLRTADGKQVTIGTNEADSTISIKNGIWKCTFCPEMICVGLRKYTFTDTVLYLEIVDITAQEQIEAIGHSIPVFELKNKTYTIGHSSGGNSSISDLNIPENSIEGLVQYARQGYWGVSCDVRLTSDKAWVLMHDETVDRTTNGTGNVKDMTLDQVKELRLKKTKDGTVYQSDYQVPTLGEWLLAGRMYGVYLSIQIELCDNLTDEDIVNAVNIVKDLRMENQVMFCSFTSAPMKVIKETDSRIFTSILFNSDSSGDKAFPPIGANGQLPAVVAGIAKYGHVGISVKLEDTRVTAEQVRLYQSHGVKVGTWTAYPNQASRARTLAVLPYGFDFISAEVCPNVLDLIYTEVTA